MSKLNTLLYEKHFFSTQPQNIQKISENSKTEIFEAILNSNSLKLFTDEKFAENFQFLNFLIKNFSIEEFDEISSKYLNKLNESYKDLINKLKISKDDNLTAILLRNLDCLNTSFANFFSSFSKNFQNYNEKHKTLMKLIPNGLKIYFKLFEDLFVTEEKDFSQLFIIFKSFSLNIITLINYFPTLMRTNESKLDNIIRIVFTHIVLNNIQDDKIIKFACVSYSMLIRLSPDNSTKMNLFVNKILENLKFYANLFTPKTIKNLKSASGTGKGKNSEKVDEKNNFSETMNLFKFSDSEFSKLKNPNLQMPSNITKLLMKILKTIFKSIQKNSILELNFNNLIIFLTTQIENFKLNSELVSISESDYIVEGLKLEEYKILKGVNLCENLKFMKFLIKNFIHYLYFYLPNLKEMNNMIILNFDTDFNKFFEINFEILNYLKILIKHGNSLFLSNIEEFIFKSGIANFTDLYVAYLERNDKTVVKVDNTYFKLAKLKTVNKNPNQKKGQKVSLIQMAKQENYNEKIENYSNQEIEKILCFYFELFSVYFQSDLFGILLLNQNYRSSLKSLVDTVILPPYAKYIFSLSENVKDKIQDFVYFYLKNSSSEEPVLDYEKLNGFLKAFYCNSEAMNSKIMQVYDFINRRKNLCVPSKKSQLDYADLTSSFVEMNKRISEKLKLRGESIIRDLDLSKIDEKIDVLNQQDFSMKKSEEQNENFKIEFSLNLKDEEEEKLLNKSKNKTIKKEDQDQDEIEFYNFTQNKKKAKNDSKVNDNECKPQVPLQASASKFTLLDNESPAKSNTAEKEKVNKIFKRKWHQIDDSISSKKSKKRPGQEFVSDDKIVLKLNTNTTAEKFKDKSAEESIQKLNQGYVPEKSESDNKQKLNKSNASDSEGEEVDSDSEMEIPDIF